MYAWTALSLDTADSPEPSYQSSAIVAAEVGQPDTAVLPFSHSARQQRCLNHRLGDAQAKTSLIGRCASPRASLSRVEGCLADSRVSSCCLPNVCVIQRVTAVKRSPLLVDLFVHKLRKVELMPPKRRMLPDVEPSDSESSDFGKMTSCWTSCPYLPHRQRTHRVAVRLQ